MTLEEAKALAEQGDVDAMMALASYYSEEGDAEESLHYYELAAEGNNLEALSRMVEASSRMAAFSLTMFEARKYVSGTEESVEKAYYWAIKFAAAVNKLENPAQELREYANDSLLLAVSRLAVVYCLGKKFDALARITKSIDDPFAQAFYGFALFKLSDRNEEIMASFELLKNLENALCWKAEYQKSLLLRALLTEMAVDLSEMYRLFASDVDSAYRVLEKALGYLTDDSAKEDIENVMSTHYRKKLFGGYAYIE